jgi:hypothetical protein
MPMPRLLTLFVAAYWTTFFAILTLAAVGEVTGEGLPALYPLLSPETSPFRIPAGAPVSAMLAIGFLLVAMLFLWTLVTMLFEERQGDGDELARIALAAAAGMMTVLLALGVWSGVGDVLSAVTLQFVALLASYGAILAEAARQAARSGSEAPGTTGPARAMAIGAAHHTMLARLSRRDPSPTKRF